MTNFNAADDLIKKRIELRDEKHLDPVERADLVNTFLFKAMGLNDPKDAVTNPLYWDMICYCVQMIAYYAQNTENEEVLTLVKIFNNSFMSLHYSFPDDAPQLGPEREEHKKIWEGLMDALDEGSFYGSDGEE